VGCEVDFEGGEGGDGAEGCMAATTTVVEGFDVIEESQASSLLCPQNFTKNWKIYFYFKS
jgi:hypothetical protein